MFPPRAWISWVPISAWVIVGVVSMKTALRPFRDRFEVAVSVWLEGLMRRVWSFVTAPVGKTTEAA